MLRLGASFLCLRKRHADKERPQTQARTSIDRLPSSYPVITLLNHPRLLKLNFHQGGAGARAGAGARIAARARGRVTARAGATAKAEAGAEQKQEQEQFESRSRSNV